MTAVVNMKDVDIADHHGTPWRILSMCGSIVVDVRPHIHSRIVYVYTVVHTYKKEAIGCTYWRVKLNDAHDGFSSFFSICRARVR